MAFITQYRRFKHKAYRIVNLLFLVVFLFLSPGGLFASHRANAQSTAQATLTAPDIKGFPTLTTYLDVLDSQGQFAHNLGPGDVTLSEDNKPAKLQEIREVQPGIRIMVAINAGLLLAVRNLQGVSRYDSIVGALQAWAKGRQADEQNDYTLLANPGPLAMDVSDPLEWLTAFNAYKPDMRNLQPNLDSLNLAITSSGDPTPRAGMQRAILYITPPPDDHLVPDFTGLTSQAKQTGVHIFIWMVGAASDFTSKGAAALTQLAGETGGQVFPFSGEEILPDVQAYFEPLRYVYSLTYTSSANTSGAHTLSAQVKSAGLELATSAQSFSLTVQPPNPMFVSPPVQITRQISAENQPQPTALAPRQQTLEVMVEFPDGHPRDLKYTRLYVDGVLVVENIIAPFNKFTWNLTGYTTTARHSLTVEVQDVLGLTTMGSQVPVLVTVVIPKQDPFNQVTQNRNLVPLIAIGIAGSALVIVLLAGWRRRSQGEAAADKKKARDPVTQPVPIRHESSRFSPTTWTEKLVHPRRNTDEPPAAWLIRLAEDGIHPLAGSPITIGSSEVTFGLDPDQVTCVIDAPSVEAVHTSLRQLEDGSFFIYNQSSVAGTWVNYAAITREGVRLEHGDLVHIGKVSFRFEMGKPTHIRRPQVRILR